MRALLISLRSALQVQESNPHISEQNNYKILPKVWMQNHASSRKVTSDPMKGNLAEVASYSCYKYSEFNSSDMKGNP